MSRFLNGFLRHLKPGFHENQGFVQAFPLAFGKRGIAFAPFNHALKIRSYRLL